ncbi:MAG: hypothetical protein LBQ10_11985, partial [Desulfovibrio sp.]|nr:hypothetical protein [Desulfovibrio sp.]
MSQSYDAIVSRLFGDEQQPQSLLLPDDAVNTTESIGNALDRATPSGVGESLRGELAEREFLRGVFDDDRSLSGGDLSAPGVESAALRASFMLNNAGRYSRDDILKSWGYSQKLNMSLSMTLDNRDTAARIASEIVPEDVKTFAPRLLRRIQNYEDSALIWRHDMQAANAFAMAFDNPLGLGEAERDVVGRGGMMAEDPASAGAGLSRGLRSGLAQTAGAAADAGREAFRDILGSVLFTGEVADEEGNIYQSGVPVLSGDWTTAAMNFFGDAARQAYQDARDIRAEAPEWLQQRLW